MCWLNLMAASYFDFWKREFKDQTILTENIKANPTLTICSFLSYHSLAIINVFFEKLNITLTIGFKVIMLILS